MMFSIRCLGRQADDQSAELSDKISVGQWGATTALYRASLAHGGQMRARHVQRLCDSAH